MGSILSNIHDVIAMCVQPGRRGSRGCYKSNVVRRYEHLCSSAACAEFSVEEFSVEVVSVCSSPQPAVALHLQSS